ncbi:MAG TPA: peptide chain release factor N(5)-glutamine methyltransferase [Thiobacillaceae bacterium]|nr:peptide chain release factor N(5)-glutamine methyltransferase [Thiobacillaceae bacterium]
MNTVAATVTSLVDAAASRLWAVLDLDRREARIEARALAAHAWRVETAWLIAHGTDVLDEARITALHALVEQRLAGHPIAYITGMREFFGRPFAVTPDALIPRPETELLVEQAIALLDPDRPLRVLDLGTGSGCVAITIALERPRAIVTGVERSPAAMALAERNAHRLGATVRFLESDWFSALAGERFDLILGNPPYVATGDPHLTRGDLRFEPRSALAAGADGLDDLRRIIREAPAHLTPRGWLWLEHGFEQGDAARELLREAGMDRVSTRSDLAGLPRISGGRVSENFTPRSEAQAGGTAENPGNRAFTGISR